MTGLAMHSRSPSGHTQSPAGSSSSDTPEPAKKRHSFLRTLTSLRPGHHHKANGDVTPPATANGNAPSPGSITKRFTAPPEAQTSPPRAVPVAVPRPRSTSPPQTASSAPAAESKQQLPRIDSGAVERPETAKRVTSDSSAITVSSITADGPARSGSKGVKWAEGYNDELSQRPRRPSSSATVATRRSSIYFRGGEGGDYMEGADTGVGSKARTLSHHIPAELIVDECPLSEHFSYISVHNKTKIGEGGAASVQKMKPRKSNNPAQRILAVKEFRPWDEDEETEMEYVRKIKSEYAIAKSCENPNVVESICLCFQGKNEPKEWFHVMEFCEFGDLNDLVKKGHLSLDDKNCMFKQLVRGVDFLHTRGIAHRDLKSENLLVNHEGCLKIADFGTSEVFSGVHPGVRRCRRPSIIDEEVQIKLCKPGLVGSRPYMAPEILERKYDYDPRGADVWSCAIVYLSLYFLGTPWEAASRDFNNYNIFCSSFEEYTSRHPDGIITRKGPLPKIANSKKFMIAQPGATNMIMGMLHPDPSKRWKISDALELVQNRDPELGGPWPCCQQEGHSDDIKKREMKVRHNHAPPDKKKKHGFSK